MLEGVDLKTLNQVKNLPDIEDKREVLELLEDLHEAKKKESARESFLGFVNYVWPAFIEGRHHKVVAEAFERVIKGDLKRLIINMPPRHTKSEFASYLLPAWFLGQNPGKKVIQASHTAELSVGFGRKVRNLVDADDFKEVFPELALRADLLIIDDPHSEQDGQSIDASVFDKTYEWYTSGPRQRLQPGGAIIIVMTRWHLRDLTGKIIKSSTQREGVDDWELIEFPAIMPSGNALWPEFWSQEELLALRSEVGSPVPAGTYLGGRCAGQAGMVETLGKRASAAMRVYYPVMGYGFSQNPQG